MLQGQAQFLGFGLTRTGFAIGRFLLAILFISVIGRHATVAIAAYPLGGIISIGVAAWFLGRGVWQSGRTVSNETMRQGYQLSAAAFIAYAAYMGLQNVDLIWVNRVFSAEQAGNYASAVVLRRVLAVLPGAVTVILYPRIVQRVKAGELPDKLLIQATALIVLPTVAASAVLLLGGEWIITLLFGSSYASAAPLLGWLGIAMIGFGVATVWLNLFLATRPWGFVGYLIALTGGQFLFLQLFAPTSLQQVAQIFAAGGWGVAIGGGLIYIFWLRRAIR
jgi:O-antigen/teichoic acid export membrane protein